MAESRQICCCGADSWTKVIAWIQIVLSTIVILPLVIFFIVILCVGVEFFGTQAASGEEKRGMFLSSGLVFSVFTLVMAMLLLMGAAQRNPNYLTAWLIYMGIGFFCCLSGCSILLIFLGPVAIPLLLSVVINGFILWVVVIFKMEVDADQFETVGVVYKV